MSKKFVTVLIISFTIIQAQTFEFQTKFNFKSNDSSQVYLVGDFNNWDPTLNPMKFTQNGWEISVSLSKGHHRYSFLQHGSNFMPDPANPLIIDGKMNEFISIIEIGKPETTQRFKAGVELPQSSLPKLIFDGEPALVKIFDSSMQILLNFYYAELTGNNYLKGQRTPIIALPSAYLRHVFPVARFLDSFYFEEIEKISLHQLVQYGFLPYVEFRYFQISGDDSRLKRIYPMLLKNYSSINKKLNSFINEPQTGRLDFWGNEKIINSPVFLKSLEALYLQNLVLIAGIIKNENATSVLVEKYVSLSRKINNEYWNSENNFYGERKNFAGLFPILAEVCPKPKIKELLSASADHKSFSPSDRYLIASGLNRYFGNGDAVDIAFNTIKKIVDTYSNFAPTEQYILPSQRFNDGYKTFWHFYESDSAKPARSNISGFYSTQDNPSTAGPGFFSMLIENFMGIELAGNENTIRWKINHAGRHGLENILFREKPVTLICEPIEGGFIFEVRSKTYFEFEIIYTNTIFKYSVNPGFNSFTIE